MNDEPSPSPGPANLDMDLSQVFLPAWAKETGSHEKVARLAARYGDEPETDRKRRDDRGGPRRDRRPEGRGPRPDRRNDRRGERRDPRQAAGNRPEREPHVSLQGGTVQILPDPRGIEGLVRQIKTSAKSFSLFDLALLVLEKPERYLVEWKRTTGPTLYQCATDGSLWLTEREAVAHVLGHHLETYYRRERVAVEPPKGAFPFVALCGMSDILLGPPNHHDYQDKLRRLHAERFGNVPFDLYKSRIRMLRDEESIQRWKDEQSSRDEFQVIQAEDGQEPVKLTSQREVEEHFRKHHASTAVAAVSDQATLSASVAMSGSTPALRSHVRRAWEELRRFPLPLAHVLGQAFVAKGLQIFKAHENITYVSVARPRYLDRVSTPVAEGFCRILNYLESHPSDSREAQWKGLVEAWPAPADGGDREAAVARDLSWLLHEGYVVDYARRGLEAVTRGKSRPAVQQ